MPPTPVFEKMTQNTQFKKKKFMRNWAPKPNQFSDKRWSKVPLKGDNNQT